VALDVSQEVSTFEIRSLFGEDQVILDKTEASSNLVVQDSQTIIIGGLIREDTTNAKSGLPFLSKTPVLGYLFRNITMTSIRAELIIILTLTPLVIKNQREATAGTSRCIENITSSDTKGRLKRVDEGWRADLRRDPADAPDVVMLLEPPPPKGMKPITPQTQTERSTSLLPEQRHSPGPDGCAVY